MSLLRSSPVSSSSSGVSTCALRSSHSDHQPRASVPSLPIRAWQQQRSQNSQVEEEQRAGDDVGVSLRSSSLSSSASSTPAGGSPALSRRTVGDRDSDWRPSRRIVRSSGYVVDPITGRYTALPSDPVSEAASAASSAVSSAPASHGSSPHSPHTSTPESPVASSEAMRPRSIPLRSHSLRVCRHIASLCSRPTRPHPTHRQNHHRGLRWISSRPREWPQRMALCITIQRRRKRTAG